MLEESLTGVGKIFDIAIGWIAWWGWLLIGIGLIYFILYDRRLERIKD